MRLDVSTDRNLIRSLASSTRYVVARMTAPAGTSRQRRPVNVSIVIDRSGSMEGDKIVLARQAAQRAIDMLDPSLRSGQGSDRFSVVIYDTEVDILIESTPATADARRLARELIAEVQPRGGTDLFEGWLRGCEQIASRHDAGAVNRCLLLTDGLANSGVTNHHQILTHVTALLLRGVQTTTFGIGADYDEVLLQAMAEAGGANYYYVESADQIPELLTAELQEALEIVVPGAILRVLFPEPSAVVGRTDVAGAGAGAGTAIRAEVLSRFPSDACRVLGPDGGAVRGIQVRVGDLASEQELPVLLALTFPTEAQAAGVAVTASFQVLAADGTPHADAQPLAWRYADHAANDAQPRDVDVDRMVARIFAARARADAAELNRSHDFQRAGDVLRRTARRVRSYAGSDIVLMDLADSLDGDHDVFAAAEMTQPMLKSTLAASLYEVRGRDRTGRGRKGRV